MPQNFGVGFVIGASVAASVNSAFNIVSNKIKATTAQLGKARHEASVLSKAITLSQQKEGLEQKVAAGDNSARLQAELAKVTQRYEQARKAALAYGDSVEAWEKGVFATHLDWTERPRSFRQSVKPRKVLAQCSAGVSGPIKPISRWPSLSKRLILRLSASPISANIAWTSPELFSRPI